jgi:hypothetical protein
MHMAIFIIIATLAHGQRKRKEGSGAWAVCATLLAGSGIPY